MTQFAVQYLYTGFSGILVSFQIRALSVYISIYTVPNLTVMHVVAVVHGDE